jgi:Holliday junction resolvase RusA-like endonuclease
MSSISALYKGPLIELAVNVDLRFYMPIPVNTSKKKRELMLLGLLRPTSTPDRTNMAKLYEDCLQGIVIKNDSQIVGGNISKFYDENPRIEITVEPI